MQNVLVTQMLLLMVQTFVTIKMDCVMKNLDVKVNMEGITVRNVTPWGILECIQIAKVSKSCVFGKYMGTISFCAGSSHNAIFQPGKKSQLPNFLQSEYSNASRYVASK